MTEIQVDENDLVPHDERVSFKATKNGKFIITLDGGYNGTGFAGLAFQTAVLMWKDCGVTLDEMSQYLVEVMKEAS
jgi:hypothetical protein